MSDAIVQVSSEEALEKVTRHGFTFVDVRTEAEFADGHPAGAFNVPFMLPSGASATMSPNPDFLRVMRERFAPDAKLVLGCRSGQRSLRAARALAEAGFTAVVNQRAGWAGVRSPFGEVTEKGWEALGLPSESGAPAGRAYADLKIT